MDQTRPLFVYFRSFQTIYRIKTVGGIRTRINWAEGKHADHLTTTTAQLLTVCRKAKNEDKEAGNDPF